MEKVVWIVGASYSGSSLLNLLLDTQPGFRGMGEGAQVYYRPPRGEVEFPRLAGGPCARCKSTVRECELYSRYHGGPFYRFNFDRYDCRVLVDSSKSVRMLTQKPTERSFQYRAIIISKAPHEAVYSLYKHAHWDRWSRGGRAFADVEAGMRFYLNIHQRHLRDLCQLDFTVESLAVRYRDVAANTGEELSKICDFLDEPFSGDRLNDEWWRTDTHVLGGNPAMVAQVSRDEGLAFAVPVDRYLEGKYQDKMGKIFVDTAWKEDRSFIAECRKSYARNQAELWRLLPALGYDLEAEWSDLIAA